MKNFKVMSPEEGRQMMKDRMEQLKKLPPPSIEEVKLQWKASADYSFEHRFDNLKNPMK